MTDIPHILGGRYEVGDLIGRGGMAQVHIGYDTRLSRTVAIKVLRSDLASDPTFLARFRREAQSAAALNHPAIVSVYDTGEENVINDSGRTVALPYIVMEYVKGRTVSKLLNQGQALPINEAVQITVGVLSALEYSHYEGIVHRDIKPGNIMITQDGKVKVMDFGIARALADSSATMTSTNSVVGTAQYLSPEQARGEIVDARSDLYSTGCLLYELLTGKPPFQGDSAVAVAYQHVSEMPKLPSAIAPDIPESLDRVVMKSLAKARENRYQNAAQMRADLLAAVRGEAVEAPSISAWTGAHGSTGTGASTAHATQVHPAIPPAPVTQDTFTGTTGVTPAVAAEEEADRKRKRRLVAAIILAIVCSLGAITAGIVFSGILNPPSKEVTMLRVPDLSGMNEEQAIEALKNAGFSSKNIEIGDPLPHDDIPEGEFVSSDPKTNSSVKKGTSITLHFSSGPDQVAVPRVTGMTQAEARQALEAVGLSVSTVEMRDEPGVEKDEAIETNPAAGTIVNPQEHESVVLVVGSGEVVLDDYVGMNVEDAKAALELLGLEVDTREVDSDKPAGEVIEQNPQASKQPIDTRIQLTVSNGRASQVVTPDPEVPQPPDPPQPTNPGTDPNTGTVDQAEQTGTDN